MADTLADIVAAILAVLGATLVLLAGVGVLRFPDLYARMHAVTKATTVGIGLVSIATAIAVDGAVSKSLLAAVMIFVTAPSAAHFVGRIAYRADGIDIELSGPDDLGKLNEAARADGTGHDASP